jgi:hypothetical protein
MESEKKEAVFLWGKEWIRDIAPPSIDIHSEIGVLVETYFNKRIGKIAFMYVIPGQIQIAMGNINILFEHIKKKTNEGFPYIIYEDSKYKEECKKWNDGKNTICCKKEFEDKINEGAA